MRLASLAALVLALAASGCSSTDPTTCDGGTEVQKVDVTVGTGSAVATVNSTVSARYAGMLTDSTVFDSGQLNNFALARSIAGFRLGIAGMKIGGRRTITIPPNLGYGPTAQPGIPSCSTLIFDVTLLDTVG